MTIADGNVLRVVATLSMHGETKMQNVFHMLQTTGSAQDDSDVVEACGEWIHDFYTELETKIQSGVELLKVEVFERVSGEWGPVGVDTPVWAGTAVATRLPSGLCMLLNAFKARTGHTDKKYIGGLTANDLEGDEWSAGALAAGQDAIDFWVVEFTATNSVKLTGAHYKTATETPKLYIGGIPAERIAYQRRRKPGVGLT